MQKFSKEQQWLLNDKYDGMMSDAFLRDCERIAAGEPLDYVIGWKDFLGCRIDLSKRPLIPRVETEYWVNKVIADCRLRIADLRAAKLNILDIFSGSGCIGIAVLKHVPEALVDFADVDELALEQIQINCKLNEIEPSRYRIIHSDIFAAPAQCGESDSPHLSPHFFEDKHYDYVLANPPYVAEDGILDRLDDSVVLYEPRNALFGGVCGLDVIRRFLDGAPAHLKLGGKIVMEYDDIQYQELERIVRYHTPFGLQFFKDQYGKWRWVELSW